MNERIKQLAVKAGAHWEHGDWNMPSAVYFSERDLEKFAELIVKECIDNIRQNMEHAKVDTLGDNDLFLETLRTSGHFYITELERHFGVEETKREQIDKAMRAAFKNGVDLSGKETP
jgi:hypothetical protein